MADIKNFQDLPNVNTDDLKQKFNDFHAQTESYVRENPTQAVLSAVGAGFILRLLPIGALVGALVRLALFALRPAIFIYGAVALYKHFQGTAEHPQPPQS